MANPLRIRRPELKAGLAEVHDSRPSWVPEEATLLVSWVDLPGENKQRTQHWTTNRVWKKVIADDFFACVALQKPHMYKNPRVHIRMDVRRKGDANNMLSRAKYVIDLLQVRKDKANGTRYQGMFGLIDNDDILTDANRTIEERSVKSEASGAFRIAPCLVAVWVWDAET